MEGGWRALLKLSGHCPFVDLKGVVSLCRWPLAQVPVDVSVGRR